MTNFTPAPINDFDPTTRAPKFTAVLVESNGVDPNTGVNTPSVDITTPLVFTFVQGGGSSPAVRVTQSGIASNGARVVRWDPGVLQPTDTSKPWSVRISVPGGTNQVTQTGTTPPPPDFSGVNPTGGETDQPPT